MGGEEECFHACFHTHSHRKKKKITYIPYKHPPTNTHVTHTRVPHTIAQVLSPDGVVCYYDTRQAGPPIEFDTGMGTVPDAVDTCSRLMLVNELATVTSNWKHAYEYVRV